MTHRDNPYDDWDWLGIFNHDNRPAEGCLRSIPTLVILSLVLAIMVAPVWTVYNIGRGTYGEKPCWLIVLSLPITMIILVVDLLSMAVACFHVSTLLLSENVQHNPFITAASFLAGGMLTTMFIAYWMGRRNLRLAERLKQGEWGQAISRHLEHYRRNSSPSKKDKR